MMFVQKITEVAHHRNGVMGESFYVVTFEANGEEMVAVLFDHPGHCAVLRISDLAEPGGITFGEGSWAGDLFEPDLRKAIADYEVGRQSHG